MDDLISRQAAIEALYDWELSYTWDEHCKEEYDSPYIISPSKVIDGLPPAQPERKKGKWIEISSISHTYKCSECGRLLVNITDGKNNVARNYPYCHCGADMRGEQE